VPVAVYSTGRVLLEMVPLMGGAVTTSVWLVPKDSPGRCHIRGLGDREFIACHGMGQGDRASYVDPHEGLTIDTPVMPGMVCPL
jgi:hypothetical protein